MEKKYVNNAPITIGGWFGIMLLSSIPLLNFIMAIIWAASPGTRVSLRNYGKAMLIWIVIVIALVVVLFATGVASLGLLSNLLQ